MFLRNNVMGMSGIALLIIAVIAVILMSILLTRFLYRLIHYGYIGNVYLYIIAAYLLCLLMSFIVNYNPIPVNITNDSITVNDVATTIVDTSSNIPSHHPVVHFFSSFFDALRMMALAFDKSVVAAYFNQELSQFENAACFIFGVVYYAISAFAVATTIIGVIIFFAKTLIAKAVNIGRSLWKDKTVYYIFSEAKVAGPAKRLARVLKERKQIVIMYVTRDSLKTQEGTEYRDSLINEGFDVRGESFSQKLCGYIFHKYFKRNFGIRRFGKYHNRKVTVYGLFANDESAIELAVNFKRGIVEDKLFYKNYRFLWGKNANSYLRDMEEFQKIDEELNKNRVVANRMKAIEERLSEIAARSDDGDLTPEQKAALEEEKIKLENEKGQLDPQYQAFLKAEKARGAELLEYLEKYHIFITYQDCDFDLVQDFSAQTLHIINTLSQYDMVSSEFILNNPIINFLPKKLESDVKEGNDNETPIEEKKYIIDLNDNNTDAFHVSFFGFGNINKPIFEKMTYAYQLWPDNKHKIHYHVYDYRANELVEKIENEYVNDIVQGSPNEYFPKPLLYKVNAECDGKDLTDYEILDSHFKKLLDSNLNPEANTRFQSKGFEIFVVSAKSTNSDIQIAVNLRKVLLKRLGPERLKTTYIFVRIGNDGIKNNILKDGEKTFVFHQKDYKAAIGNSYGAPIIIFGENTNMAEFIDHDYKKLIKLGLAASQAYDPNKEPYQVKLEWLQSSKLDVLSNTCSFYSLPTKFELIGYHLDFGNETNGKGQWTIVDKNKKETLTTDNLKAFEDNVDKLTMEINFGVEGEEINRDADMLTLSQLEHNRWTAANYLLFHSTQMSKKTFKKENSNHFAGEEQKKFKTNINEKGEHICMTTNAGLEELYTFLNIDTLPKNKEIAIKLVLENDINQMKESLKTIATINED